MCWSGKLEAMKWRLFGKTAAEQELRPPRFLVGAAYYLVLAMFPVALHAAPPGHGIESDPKSHTLTFTPVLGVPFGQICEVSGKLLTDEEKVKYKLNSKANMSETWMALHRINDTSYEVPVLMRIKEFRASRTMLGSNSKGDSFHLVGYETIQRAGSPTVSENQIYFPGGRPIASSSYHFVQIFVPMNPEVAAEVRQQKENM